MPSNAMSFTFMLVISANASGISQSDDMASDTASNADHASGEFGIAAVVTTKLSKPESVKSAPSHEDCGDTKASAVIVITIATDANTAVAKVLLLLLNYYTPPFWIQSDWSLLGRHWVKYLLIPHSWASSREFRAILATSILPPFRSRFTANR